MGNARLIGAQVLVFVVATAAHADEVHPTAMDVARLRAVSGPAISADGRLSAYVVQEPRFDPQAKPKDDDDTAGGWSKVARIYVVPTSGGSPKAMTAEAESVSNPLFSPH